VDCGVKLNERKISETHRTLRIGTSHFDDQKEYVAMVWTCVRINRGEPPKLRSTGTPLECGMADHSETSPSSYVFAHLNLVVLCQRVCA